jgi:hypothetical protein
VPSDRWSSAQLLKAKRPEGAQQDLGSSPRRGEPASSALPPVRELLAVPAPAVRELALRESAAKERALREPAAKGPALTGQALKEAVAKEWRAQQALQATAAPTK